MTYDFERPLDKAGDTYTRQGYANRILKEHGDNKTPSINPFAHWDPNKTPPANPFPYRDPNKPPPDNPIMHWDPNFDQILKAFKDAKPLGSDQHSMNEIHDHRSVDNDVNINVTGSSPLDRTERSLSRPKNADLIRNTASYAA